MIAFPEMLVEAAVRANMKVPEDANTWEDCREEFPHFYVFCVTQLCRPVVYHGEHWDNACVIGEMTEAEVKKTSITDLISCGYSIAF